MLKNNLNNLKYIKIKKKILIKKLLKKDLNKVLKNPKKTLQLSNNIINSTWQCIITKKL